MAEQPINPSARSPMELTPAEREIIERVRMTPAERTAEQEARRQAHQEAMTPQQRQAFEARAAKFKAMTPAERKTYHVGQRLVGTARMLRREIEGGLPLSQIVTSQETQDAAAIGWLRNELSQLAGEN